uniref:Cysteine dioxygenase n=1 Tax=Leptobrachium leishanense TaxID=445787 RepID=A0A8C5PM70_9ANUR
MDHTEVLKPQTLDDLIQILHEIFDSDKVNTEEVQNIMESYESNPLEWGKYAKFDQYRYTRNLVDEGNGKFNLMILCWGEGHGSSIHDHTDSHCFLKILQGNLKETMYEWPQKKNNGEMAKKSEGVLKLNQCAYINDSIGLHRVENPSHTETAVSLHLYSPPFDQCHTFDQRTGHKNVVKMTFWSKHGERTPFSEDTQQQIVRETFHLVSKRDENVCNFLEGGLLIGGSDNKLIYRHYATLYFVFCVDSSESELGILDLIQVFVETLDKCFENVCELDLIFHVDKVHNILAEMVMGGMVLETNMNEIVTQIDAQTKLEKSEAFSLQTSYRLA